MAAQVHSPDELRSHVAQNSDKLSVLMCKARSCRPCKVQHALPCNNHAWASMATPCQRCCSASLPGPHPNQLQTASRPCCCCLSQVGPSSYGVSGLQAFTRRYQRLAEKHTECDFLSMYGDETPATRKLMMEMEVKVTPTFMLYRGGQRVHSLCGINEDNLKSAIQEYS